MDTGPIIWCEIKSASLMWIYTIQHYHFTAVFIAIKQKRCHCLQKQLGLQLDGFEILRCYGRYTYTDIRDKAKYPKLLPRGSYFMKLLILEVHGHLVHAEVSHTLNQNTRSLMEG